MSTVTVKTSRIQNIPSLYELHRCSYGFAVAEKVKSVVSVVALKKAGKTTENTKARQGKARQNYN